jgi:N-acetylneuraminate synthase
MSTKFIAEIGINHNGDIELCKKMMMLSKVAGCKYAKIQKRNPDVCVPEKQKLKPKSTPWGQMTYIEYKHKIEFSEEQIKDLFRFAELIGIELFASTWDKDSVDVMSKYTNIGKLGSASINDLELCKYAREKFDFLIISTGMSTEKEIEECVKICNPDVIMHTNSTYPCPVEDLNLRYIEWLKNKYPNKEIGYSGHEYRLQTTTAAVALGATWVERHITLDRNMWGSDQKSSVEPAGLFHLMADIKAIDKATQFPPQERLQFLGENIKRESLRKKF